ncbi:MAG: ACP S-malonyltransferase [Candidatus Levyibacteriota bacterium]
MRQLKESFTSHLPFLHDKEKEQQPVTAWFFPGQGIQEKGMGQDLFNHFEIVRYIYKKADEILGYSISDISFNNTDNKLSQTEFAQPAIFVYNYAYMCAFQQQGKGFNYRPDYVAGISLGEYNALVASGAMNFEDALKLVKVRGEEIGKACRENPGTLFYIKRRGDEDDKIIEEVEKETGIEKSLENTKDQIVFGGTKEQVERAKLAFNIKGIKARELDGIEGAFHTSLMKPAVTEFIKTLNKVKIKRAKIPIIANTTALPIVEPDEIRKELINQLTKTVSWKGCHEYAVVHDLGKTFETGSKGILSDMNVREHGGEIAKLSLAIAGTLTVIGATVWYLHEHQEGK